METFIEFMHYPILVAFLYGSVVLFIHVKRTLFPKRTNSSSYSRHQNELIGKRIKK